MPDDEKLASDFMKQFEEENPETTTAGSNSSSENIEPVQEITSISEPAYPQSQELQVPAVQQTNQINNNYPQVNLAISAINAVTSATCMGRYVQISNYPAEYAKIICDANCNAYLGILNQQTNQYGIVGTVVLEDSEYAVYQNYQKVGTLSYNSFEDTVWHFVPFGVNMPQQGQNAQYPAQNTQQA